MNQMFINDILWQNVLHRSLGKRRLHFGESCSVFTQKDNAFSRWNHSSITKSTPVRLINIQALFFGDSYQT